MNNYGLDRIEFPDKVLQTCPLCGMRHPILVQGLVESPEDSNKKCIVLDRGYSFCNCNNIFYTDWSNMDSRVYNEAYAQKYNSDGMSKLMYKYVESYYPALQKLNPNIKVFAEIGAINPTLLDAAQELGWETTCIDINPNVKYETHKVVINNVEDDGLDEQVDVIWASHIFEHFKDPLKVARNLYDSLNEDGILFVAMPDPSFIDWRDPHTWVHWHLREHHILWDMESFIEQMEKIGFTCKVKNRNCGLGFICFGDYHLIFQKVAK